MAPITIAPLPALLAETGLSGHAEHDMSAVFGFADRVAVMDQGTLVTEGLPEAVRRDAWVRAVYLGGAGYDTPPSFAGGPAP